MVNRLNRLPLWGTYLLLAYMPFHIFLSQWLSTFTGGLSAWKVGKDVLTMALVLACLGLVLINRVNQKKFFLIFAGVAIAYLLLHVGLYFIRKDTTMEVGVLATVYNNRLFWYFLIGLATALLAPKHIDVQKLIKFVLIISTIVCFFGVLQYYLPKDSMTHFGYSVERGVKPAFFIDDKPDLPRIMSTIRDPNSLGAFLVLPILLIVQGLLDKARSNRRMLFTGLLGLHGLALFLTFSRGAWAATFVSLVALILAKYRQELIVLLKKIWLWALAGTLVLLTGAIMLQDQYVVQNIIFHSDETTTAELDSNELHADFVEKGATGIVDEPLGHGPGTAGIVSIQNEAGGLLTENYFLQIGYEVGVLGLAIFAGVLFFVQKKLLPIKSDLAFALAVAFWGYLLMSMVAHLWTNEAVALQWWLLAGVAIGLGLQERAKD